MNNFNKEVGFVVGCDANQEWMLDWWMENYSKHNKLPVAIANFGMSSKKLKKYKPITEIIDLTSIKTKLPWFKKPLAIVNSPFKKTCLVDIDCEVLKPLDSIFNYLDEHHVCVTKDPLNTYCKKYITSEQIPMATGVVVAYSNNELIKEWAERCVGEEDIRGDQEVFNNILTERLKKKILSTKIRIIPDNYQWLRIYEMVRKNPEAYIIHWTGPDGKKIIKEKLKIV